MSTASSEVSLRRRLLPVLSAWLLSLGLIGATSAIALAGPESGVDVVVHVGDTEDVAPGDPPTACTFHLHFQAAEVVTGYYDIRVGDEDGSVLLDGVFDTTSGDDRAPDTGAFELPAGTYVVTWDDEEDVDRSFDQQTVVVACGSGSPSPSGSEQPGGSGSPSPTGSEAPIGSGNPTPTGSEAPIGSGPTGSVGGIQVTPPATDASAPGRTTSSSAALPILVMLGLTALLAAWAIHNRPTPAARKVRSRRRQ